MESHEKSWNLNFQKEYEPCVLNGESAGVPEDAVADRSLRFPAFCNALGERRSQRGRNC